MRWGGCLVPQPKQTTIHLLRDRKLDQRQTIVLVYPTRKLGGLRPRGCGHFGATAARARLHRVSNRLCSLGVSGKLSDLCRVSQRLETEFHTDCFGGMVLTHLPVVGLFVLGGSSLVGSAIWRSRETV